jgi:multidrug efflux system membrane fusion protein
VPVEALEPDNRTPLDRGMLEVVDNQVDQTTGTVKVKAVFPNDALQLWPGSFVNVRLTLDTIRAAVVAPTAAVQRGPNGAFVYTVAEERAVLRKVAVGRQTETVSVIESGLTPPERVVTTGFARLSDGEPVRVADAAENEEAVAAAAANPAPRRRRLEGEARGPGGEGRGPPGERRRGAAASGTGASADVPTSSIGGAERPPPVTAGPQGEGAPSGAATTPAPPGPAGTGPAPGSRAGARPAP